ncbi:NAD(P)-dependent alcohol dehydrogenase [Nocardioides euryhalodurans]|uniref:NAD(P)-dependent alcohol dehydrogenase n=1 Tax=Nocardioides euryhalodurans TaxID=2518370 RepID=A0A4P7GLX5_9ACTN|nr:NAD(P)-dependent alcohol dehydrogenase [Nocardioides euryhalodurans]QBR92993.1 NAD(P)-dependent alcohol dehydrogenase [Nocardioides euryhalodurans]
MKAIVRTEYGSTDRVVLADRPDPVPGPGEVLLVVRAAGVDRGVWHLMTGEPRLMRLATGLRRPRRPVLGRDVAGVVAALGEGVTGLAVGDEVMGTAPGGTFAELAVTSPDRLVAKPAAWTFEEAAAVPISGLTALQAVHDVGRVRAGQRVLVLGASGGVGSFVVQLARHAGARVDAVCSATKAEFVRGLGADRVLPHGPGADLPGEDGTPAAYDVVIDIGGGRSIRRLRRVLAPRGTLVIVGGETGGPWLSGIQRQLGAAALSPLVRQRLRFFVASEKATELARLVALAEEGAFVPAVERTWPLPDAAAAIDHLAEGRARGKLVVSVG